MREVLYAMHRPILEQYLKEKSSATVADMKAITDLWDKPIALLGTAEAVDKIYFLDGNVAHIAISGPLSMDGPDLWDLFWGYGGTAYRDIIAALDRAKTDPLVKSIVLDINSPGGVIDGVDQTWQAIRSVGKPITTHAGSLMASAAYWIASAADKIYASAPTDEIGSIGVLVATYDWSKWEESIGIKEIVITSSNAPDKAPDIATKHGRDTIKAQLDALERIFYSRVSEGRGVTSDHIKEHFGKGGLLVAADPSPDHEDAIRAGMIDGLIVNGAVRAAGALTGMSGEIIENAVTNFNEAINSPLGETNTPAQAGHREDKAMTLSEFLAANPSANSEIDRIKADARTAGREEAQAEQSARIDRVIGVITSEAYPANIKALAGDVLAGRKGIDAFDAAVTVYDAEAERRKSESAQAETGEIGAVGAEKPEGASADEKAMDAAAKAGIEKAKAQREAVGKWL
jgi:ClpP class serine protease